MNYDENAYKYVPTYGDEYTGYHRHIISVAVFFYSNTLQSMLVDYAVTDMGFFFDYSDAATRAKTMWGNGITRFILHFSQCITFRQSIIVSATLIAKELLYSFYSRLGFKVIEDFAVYPNFEKARNQFIFKSEKSKYLQKQNWLTMSSNHPTTCYNFL